MKIWTGFMWLRKEYSGSSCEQNNESFSFIKVRNFLTSWATYGDSLSALTRKCTKWMYKWRVCMSAFCQHVSSWKLLDNLKLNFVLWGVYTKMGGRLPFCLFFFCMGYLMRHSVVRLYSIEWMLTWKGFGNKWSWLNQGSIPAFARRDWGRPRKP
jgi:hypothetical protein